jgi:hypothetical protein
MALKTIVYVDGFNLYYGCLRETPYRWLDLSKLCRALLPKNQIVGIRYFTAQVQARPWDATQPQRQQAYLRALRTLPEVTIHEGHFLTKPTRLPLADPPPGGLPSSCVHRIPGGPRLAWVNRTEEKGSDVNLATYLLCDGFYNEYEVAAVISNDSDLALPIQVARRVFNRNVIVLNPCKVQSVELRKVASFVKPIRAGVLQSSQFPPSLTDANGAITKPSVW